MKKLTIILSMMLFFAATSYAQVAINKDGSQADASAMLDVKATDAGFLPPRMTEVQRDAISSPAAGLIIYCIDCIELQTYNGTTWVSLTTGTATPPNQAPTASSVSFSGTLQVGEILTGSYTYSDSESDPEGTSTFVWYRADDASGTNQAAISGASSQTYTLIASDENKYIAFEVTPVASTGTSPGTAVMSVYQGAIVVNQAPTASSVTISGTSEVGQTLTGSYTYSDAEGDPEGTSTFVWYRADDASGTNEAAISGATVSTYTAVAADENKYVAFEVTPVAATGTSPGTAVKSAYQEVTAVSVPHVTGANSTIWMDRNLGASQVATSSTDAAAYGDLYQWGRLADGHESRTSGTTTTLSTSDVPGHSNFIKSSSSPYDWRSPKNDNLWQGTSGTNNPCPSGYRLPTETELNNERVSWSSNTSAGAYASALKFTMAGYRSNSNGSLTTVGSSGRYWSSTVDGARARNLFFNSSLADMRSNYRASGFSVRCIKD